MTKKLVIPWELKADIRIKGWASTLKGFLYAIREEYGATAALKMYERVQNMDDRVKNLTKTILEIFKIGGTDAETIGEWFMIWCELIGFETKWLERSKTIARVKVTKCPYKTEPRDISDWSLIFQDIIVKTINPKATVELPVAMCAGDPHCEYVYKIEA